MKQTPHERMINDMTTIEIKIYNENEMRCWEKEFKQDHWNKVSDCMWAKIYTKGNLEYILSREY